MKKEPTRREEAKNRWIFVAVAIAIMLGIAAVSNPHF